MSRALLLTGLVLVPAAISLADVFSYECDSLPVDAGWSLLQVYCDPIEWVADGWLHQHTEICPGTEWGQQFDYGRDLAEFQGAPHFFIEWRMYSDGLATGLDFGSPAVLAAGGIGPALYHFVLARDQIRFVRDNPISLVIYPEILPGVPHIYRLEIQGGSWYTFYVDREVISEGVPAGPYPFPGHDPAINIRAKTYDVANTVWWDYIRYGDIPADGSGDYDTSGTVDAADFYFFAEYFSGPGVDAGPGARWADFDADTDVDCADWMAFQAVWTDPVDDPPVFSPCIGFGSPIPTVSQWGVGVMALLITTCATLVFFRRRLDGLGDPATRHARAG